MPFIERPCGSIFYRQEGSGSRALVFVHGALCDHTDWNPQLDHFAARGWQVLAPDLKGHGQSSRTPGGIGVEAFSRDLQALIEHLGLERVVLVGHSMGCRVVLQTWSDLGDRVAGVVLVDGAYLASGLLPPDADREVLARQASERAEALYRQVEPAVRARRGFGQMFFDPRFDRERDAAIERAASLPPHVARELMPDFAAWDLRHMEPVLARLDVPVLAVACTWMDSGHERRPLAEGVDTPWLQALRQHVPQATVLRWFGGGHFPMIEQPQRVNGVIEAWMEEWGMGRGSS
ncbi:alpha/beta hydrolase [Ramlibacter sp. AW1]|uniref:Alpha/beta hydrolase n=1 Tax=Ramlibacter aurantiacus TaxID=2801330 RepID=A0A937D5P2_9BURK|nr:alpha/beta hydrolase [Ramlibacter aurantiacus]MBL0422915.1 alpha/beta hydrolase [Ramlibacter aurantiacus]